MSRVWHDYKCPEHGYFEATGPECPLGCKEGVEVVFLKAPRHLSEKTKKTDKTVKQLAIDFQMSDIKSTKEGESQTGYYKRNNAPEPKAEPRPGDAAIWGGQGLRNLNMSAILAGNAVKSVAGEPIGVNPTSITQPLRPSVVINDHENLKIK